MRGVATRRKRYVEVTVRYKEDGSVWPLSITWDDGRTFHIDQITDVRQAASLKVGGMGVRYIVCIGQHTTCLFFEDPRWFVEEVVFESHAQKDSVSGAWDEAELNQWAEMPK